MSFYESMTRQISSVFATQTCTKVLCWKVNSVKRHWRAFKSLMMLLLIFGNSVLPVSATEKPPSSTLSPTPSLDTSHSTTNTPTKSSTTLTTHSLTSYSSTESSSFQCNARNQSTLLSTCQLPEDMILPTDNADLCLMNLALDNFIEVMNKYDCRQSSKDDPSKGYSNLTNCATCQVSYPHWLCSSYLYYMYNGTEIPSCTNLLCLTARRACPYLHPTADNDNYTTEPAILCNDDDGLTTPCYFFPETKDMLTDLDLTNYTCTGDTICILHSGVTTLKVSMTILLSSLSIYWLVYSLVS